MRRPGPGSGPVGGTPVQGRRIMQTRHASSSVQRHAMIELCILETFHACPTRLAMVELDSGNSLSEQEHEISNLFTHLSRFCFMLTKANKIKGVSLPLYTQLGS